MNYYNVTPSFQTAGTYGPLIAQIIYYILLIITLFTSAASIYILLRYGKSRVASLTISVIYMVVYLSLVASGTAILSGLK